MLIPRNRRILPGRQVRQGKKRERENAVVGVLAWTDLGGQDRTGQDRTDPGYWPGKASWVMLRVARHPPHER